MNMIIKQYDGKYEMLYLNFIGIHFVITKIQIQFWAVHILK